MQRVSGSELERKRLWQWIRNEVIVLRARFAIPATSQPLWSRSVVEAQALESNRLPACEVEAERGSLAPADSKSR